MGFFDDISQQYGFSADASDQAAFAQGRLSEDEIKARMATRAGSTSDRAYDSQGPEINNGNGGTLQPAQWTQPQAQWTQPAASTGSGSYGSFAGGMGFGAAPAPFGETYTPGQWGETYAPLARPSHLQGAYAPGQWGETFAAPAKPGVLDTPYALPTQAELEASPGYTAGADLMQRGMERSAAARGSVLSGGFVGRTLPRAMGEYAGNAYGNMVGQTLGARQQQVGEYQGDVSNAFQQYQQRYGQFADAQGLALGARGVNENAFQGDQATNLGGYQTRFNTQQANEASNLAGYKTRYGQYLDQAGMRRQADQDVWSRNMDLSDISLRAAALARP